MAFYWYNEELPGAVKLLLSRYALSPCDCKFGGRTCLAHSSGKVRIICPYTYRDFEKTVFPNQEQILRAIARTTAMLHENGLLHKDYSAGNILFRTIDEKVEVEIIDLNRMRFGNVGIEAGCKNFERLPGTHEMFAILAEEYAKARGFDVQTCLELIEQAHSLSD